MIPCEFCGIQLEEEILFHHQVLNRICWATSHCSRMGPVPGALVAHFRNSGSCPWLGSSHTELWDPCEGLCPTEAPPEKYWINLKALVMKLNKRA